MWPETCLVREKMLLEMAGSSEYSACPGLAGVSCLLEKPSVQRWVPGASQLRLPLTFVCAVTPHLLAL